MKKNKPKVILAMVMSLDGKTTKGAEAPYKWASKEDQKHLFDSVIASHQAIVMGKKTFLSSRSVIKLEAGKLRIVLTHNPEKMQKFVVANQLEFVNETPFAILKRLQEMNYKKVLVLGGSATATAFFRQNLIDEVWLTIEPKIFGMGKGLVIDEALDISLQLISSKKLNTTGTLLLKYKVI